MIRRLVERLSRERVLRRRLPSRVGGGRLFVTPDSALSYWGLDLERLGADLFDFAERFVQPGHRVWDVGANLGLFAFAAAHRAGVSGEVFAFEPDPFCADLLRRSARAAEDAAGVHVLPLAAFTEVDLLPLRIAERGRSSNHLEASEGNSQAGGVRERLEVPAVPLDWLMERRGGPQVMKIDVEGAEVPVLEGALGVLRLARPVVLCEVGATQVTRVTELLRSVDYGLFDWETRGERAVERATFATLALPLESS